MKIAFFDVDHTLMKGYSGFYTTLALIQKNILKKRRLPAALFYQLISPLHTVKLEKMYQIAVDDMAGVSLDEILQIGRECFEKWIKPRLFHEGIETVKRHKKAGDLVYLLTSGPSMTIQILAEFLGVEGHFSVGPMIDSQGILTRELRLPIYYREGKLAGAEEALKKHEGSWKNCTYYADNIDDIFVLEKVAEPRLVNPDRELRRIGLEKGWPILEYSRVLGQD